LIKKGKRRIAIEIKSSTSPKISTGFRSSIETIAPEKAYVIAQVEDAYPVTDNITVLPLDEFINKTEQL
jgi:predicted AAA+ superfamily ATPase